MAIIEGERIGGLYAFAVAALAVTALVAVDACECVILFTGLFMSYFSIGHARFSLT